jgi:C-terminal processing protease CtpA/Prc
MKIKLFQRCLLIGLALLLLTQTSAIANSALVKYESDRIIRVSRLISSEYVTPVAESTMASACLEGILKIASQQQSDAAWQSERLKIDRNSLAEVLGVLSFFVDDSPSATNPGRFGDACLHRMFQALDPKSAYFDPSELEKQIRPPPVGTTTAQRDVANAQIFLSKIVDRKYLYLRVGRLDDNALRKLVSNSRAIDPEVFRSLSGIVLDLRSSPGGLLKTSVGVAAAFLPTSSVIALTVARESKLEKYLAEPEFYTARSGVNELQALPAALKMLPLLVLVNRQTRAGAEAIAAALQDNRRAKIIGEQTPGDGTIQTFRLLGTDTAIKLTTSKLVRPNGDAWDGNGVAPDLITTQKVGEGVELGSKDDAELAEALQMYDKQ